MTTCRDCDATWSGRNVAHCAACHETFSGVSLFDLHRVSDGAHGSCRRPEDIPRMTRRRGMWRWPELSDDALQRRLGGDS